ncbi:copper chaperone [Sphaerochaeta pleomorpha str. Grapes]|uniref:Copper chaperone n=1 Tax=Sphaerochaeta pleomorpha (strain ATCC BAA-1885 / DSM 22778 / Grapes) TaxID=158190 RepID=G8QV78_SPHPG|nr:heavy-metal-associated domain-containing protein [Sphaerochaeta pleomorpha]AEV30393.1 copper chaperone [Sphaerochaeta pleomorpha str. Grapes]
MRNASNPIEVRGYPFFTNFLQIAYRVWTMQSVSRWLKGFFKKTEKTVETNQMEHYPSKKLLIIEGMNCGHCTMKVKAELLEAEGVQRVQIDLTKKSALVEGFTLQNQALIHAVAIAGYQVTQILGH